MGQFRSPVSFSAEDAGDILSQKLNELVTQIERSGILSTERQGGNAIYQGYSGGSNGGGGGSTSTSLSVSGSGLVVYDVTSLSFDSTTGFVTTTGLNSASIALAQDIRTTASPTFAGLTLTGNTGVLRADAGVVSDIADGAANTVLGMNAAGGASEYKTVTGGDGIDVNHTANNIDVKITFGAANTVLGMNAAGNATEFKTLTGGTGITVAHTAGDAAFSIDFTEFDWNSILVNYEGTPVIDTMGKLFRTYLGEGRLSGGVLTDSGGATYKVTIAAGEGLVRTANAIANNNLVVVEWGALETTAIADGETKYIFLDYNGGTPAFSLETTPNVDDYTKFRLGWATREGTTLHVVNAPQDAENFGHEVYHWASEVFGLHRADFLGGLIIGETGTRNVTLTAGSIYFSLHEFEIAAVDTSGVGNFIRYYKVAGVWTQDATNTQWPNDQYSDGTDLQNFTSNRYGNIWWYVDVEDGDLVMLYGSSNAATQTVAEAEAPPAVVPDRVSSHCVLLGRFVIRQGGATATLIQSSFTSAFNASGVTDHGDLAGLADDDHTQYMHTSTARTVSAVHTVTNGIAFTATNPADAGLLRLGNTQTIAWRNAAAGGNETLSVNASDQFVMTGPLVADAFIATGTAAAAGAVRLVNNTAIAWRNSENNADVTLTVGADEIAVFSGALNAASLTLTTDLAIADGGTGGGTAQAARVNILPSMAGKGITYYLRINAATDDVEWATVSGGSAAGSDTQVQFNDGGTAFGGDAGLVYNKTTNVLTISDALAVGASGAAAGAIRLANNTAVAWRNAAAGGDVTLTVNASDVAVFSGALNAASLTLTTDLAIADGGTGASTAAAARVALLPSMAGLSASYYLRCNAGLTDVEWATVTAAPAGSDAQIQYNNGGAAGGTAGFEWLDASGSLKYYVVAGSGFMMHTGSLLMNQVDLTTSSITKLLIKASVAGDLCYIENTSTNPIMALKGGTTSGGVTAFSIRNSTPTIIMDLKYDGAFAVRGAGAGLTFQERDGSPDWQWYGTGGLACLWDGGENILEINDTTAWIRGRFKIDAAVSATEGNLWLAHATSNYIYWRAAGVGAPAATTRTAGAKLVLWPAISGTAVDYAIGIDSSTMWFSVPDTASLFKIYHYTTVTHTFGGPASAAGTRGLTIQGIPPSFGILHLIGNADNAESAIQFADASDATDNTSWLFGRSIVTADSMEFWYDGAVKMSLTTTGRLYVLGEVAIDGDLAGGVAGCNTFTGASTLSAGGATFTLAGVSGGTARVNSGWIKMYVGTTAYYFPVWAAITG